MKKIRKPVMTTSVRFEPDSRLQNLPPGASLPLPYDGNGSISGHSDSSCFENNVTISLICACSAKLKEF